MTQAFFTPPTPHFIDTAPIVCRYKLLMSAMMAFISVGRDKDVLRLSYKLRRLVRVFIRADRHNGLLRRKEAMLAHPGWRAQVLRELGGVRRLKLWEGAWLRAEERRQAQAPSAFGASPPRTRDCGHAPAWRRTPERLAKSERLKARARDCAKACQSPNIYRDRVRMDFDGMFRLPPIARSPGAVRELQIYTAADISNYGYNAMPFAPLTGLGPATVWPVEFYTAMLADREKTDRIVIPAKQVDLACPNKLRRADTQADTQAQRPVRSFTSRKCSASRPLQDDKGKHGHFIPLPAFIGETTYRQIFENPF